MIAVVTGASGLLGGNLAIALCRAGHTVRATRRGQSRVTHLDAFPIDWVPGDVGDPDALVRAFRGADVVFHCAAAVSIRRTVTPELQAVNVDGTRHVLDAVRAAGVPRLVHCSSVVACGLSEHGAPSDESARWNFDEHGLDDGYCVTKRRADELVAAATDVDAVTVLPTYMFGPYDARPSSGRMIVDLVRGRVPGVTPGWNNFVDVRDVASGMILAWEKGRRGERYILGGEDLPYQDIFAKIAAVAGARPPRLVIPRWAAAALGALGDVQEIVTGREPVVNSVTVRWGFCTTYRFTSAKAERELGYRHGPIEPAIRDAIAWFREQGML